MAELSPAQVAEIRARAEQATPNLHPAGNFVRDEHDRDVLTVATRWDWLTEPCFSNDPARLVRPIEDVKRDARFHAAARTHALDLCDSYDAQARRIAELEAESEGFAQESETLELRLARVIRERNDATAEIERLKADADASYKHLTGLLADAKVNIDRMQAIIEADEAENARLKAKLAEAERDSARLSELEISILEWLATQQHAAHCDTVLFRHTRRRCDCFHAAIKYLLDAPTRTPRCAHDRLDEDGICRQCGADRRGF